VPRERVIRHHANPLLARTGIAMLIVGTFAMILGREAVVVGPFLVLGVALVTIAVFEPRMQGIQKVGATGVQINLNDVEPSILQAEQDLLTPERVRNLEDLT